LSIGLLLLGMVGRGTRRPGGNGMSKRTKPPDPIARGRVAILPSVPPTGGIEMKDRRVEIIVLALYLPLNLLAAMAPGWPPGS